MNADADTAGARAQLRALDHAASAVDGRTARVRVDTSDASRAAVIVSALSAAISAVGAAIPAAAAGAAAIPAVVGAAGQGVAALVGSLSGIGDAVTALGEQETKSAGSSVAAGSARRTALRAVDDAQRQAARTAITTGEQIQAADLALGRAREDADRAAVQGARAVEAARENLASVQVQAARRTQDAEVALTRAQQSARDAQAALNRARADAAERISDMRLALSGAALDEEAAQLALLRAQERLAQEQERGRGGLDLAEAELGARQAAQRLAEVRERYGDLRDEASEAARAGVEGDSQVVAAQRQLRSSLDQVRASEDALRQSRIDGAADVRRAQQQVAEAQERAAEQQQAALQRISDAQTSLASAQRDAAWAQEDSARAVAQAQQQVADAMGGSAASADKLAEAMDKLSPAGQEFARFLHSRFNPELRRIGQSVQESSLPQFQDALDRLLVLSPMVSEVLADTGDVLGDLAVQGSRMMTSGPWQADFRTIGDANNRMLKAFGLSGLELADSFRSITVAGLPMTERFANATLYATDLFNEFIQGKRASGELDQFFAAMSERLAAFGEAAGQVLGAVIDLSTALAPLGEVVLEIVGAVAEMIGNFAEANPLITQAAAAALIAGGAIVGLSRGMQALSVATSDGRRGIGAVVSFLGALPERADRAGQAVGGFAGRMAGAADGGERAASRTGAFLSTAGRFASALPVAGLAVGVFALAMESMTTSAEDAADAILQGGLAAEQTRKKVADQNTLAGWGWLDAFGGPGQLIKGTFVPSMQEAEDAARQQFAALTPLQQAQQRVTQATNDHALAVQRFGANSPQAISAQQRLAVSVGKLELQQDLAADATKSHTDRILEQRDVMLGSADADLAFRQSLIGVEQAQRALNDAVAEHGPKSLEARDAELALEGQMYRVIQAADEAARANFAHRDSADADKASIDAVNRAMFDLAVQAGENVPPKLLTMVGSMDRSALAALGARIETDRFGNAVAILPSGKSVPITAPGAVQATDQVRTLHAELDKLTSSDWVVKMLVTPQYDPLARHGDTNIPLPLGNATGNIVAPMASGGTLTPMGATAQIVPPNTWRVIGDRMVGDEAFIPLDRSPRSQAILAEAAERMGYTVMPLADGGVLGMANGGLNSESATAANDATQALTTTLQALTAQVTTVTELYALYGAQSDFVTTATGVLTHSTAVLIQSALAVLAGEITSRTVPTLQLLQQHAGVLSVQAIRALHATLPPLQGEMGRTAQQVGASWQSMTAAARTSQSGQAAAMAGIQSGLRQTGQAFDNTAIWIRDAWGRIGAYTADPVRWAIQFPLNAGLIGAWNVIDRHFALGRPLGMVPIPFAAGGRVTGGVPGRDSVPAMLMPNEVVFSTRAVDNLGGPAAVSRLHDMARAGIIGPDARLGTGADSGPRQALMRQIPLDGMPLHMAYGGVVPHVASAGAEIERLFGRLPGGIGGVGGRPNASDHPSGHALDFMTMSNQPLGDRIASHLVGHAERLAVKYLIWKQQINEGDGWEGMEDRGSITANHFDHVHASFLRDLGLARAFSGAGMFDIGAFVREQLGATYRMLGEIPGRFGGNNVAHAMGEMIRQAAEGVAQWSVQNIMPMGVSGDVESWRPTVLRALAMTGQPASLADLVLMQMRTESGGNPRAINLWDSNAAKGTPSKGLMQVIDPTFAANRDPSLPNDVWDPLANIVASIRYAIGRYGSLQGAYRGVGYDSGGWLMPGTGQVYNATGQPEAVLTQDQWRLLRDAALGQRGGDSYSYTINQAHRPESVAAEIERRHRLTIRTRG
ncbi:transglycosylase SLT domain-containing protein [Saccharopolyspora sp. 6V]|uniref:transglycosylase SLT domain-containing protein n=1 Tax=Saccharopolyspora sp. 6V TaxID=2877239 RepID=UPI001CD3915D|nr:transglycosylase SLT domain-containing protein [Saccharopolyspora sp. 6V]MCA1191612.1 transglycosylase SLT domain-containing protein [Saccharopolyspora sp. 6V]